MVNTNLARTTTRPVTRVLVHVAGLAMTIEGSSDEVIQLLTARTGIAGIRARYVTGSVQFVTADGTVVDTATLESVTRDEPCPWLCFLTGASDFPMQLEAAGTVYDLTAQTGHASVGLVAQYRSAAGLVWAAPDGTVFAGEVSKNDIET